MCYNKGMDYYTYAYLREDGSPYYIGKGRDRRAFNPHDGRNKNFTPPKDRILFLKTGLSEQDALDHETYMISVFGRKDNGTGILSNLTDGGDGISGHRHSTITKNKIKVKRAQQIFTEETHRKRALSNTGKKRTPEQINNIREGQRKDPVTFVHTDGTIVTTTLVSEFCLDYGLQHPNITKVMKGTRKSHKGWRLSQ